MKKSFLLAAGSLFVFASTTAAQKSIDLKIDCDQKKIIPSDEKIHKGDKVVFSTTGNCCPDLKIEYSAPGNDLKTFKPDDTFMADEDAQIIAKCGDNTFANIDIEVIVPPRPTTTQPARPGGALSPLSEITHPTQPILAAIELDKLWRAGAEKNKDSVRASLEKYGIKGRDYFDISYLKKYAKTGAQANAPNGEAISTAPGAALNIFNPTVIIGALANLAVERFKQELTIAYLEKFRKELDNSPEFRTLLPDSYEVLRHGDPFNYPAFIPRLRENAFTDMENLPRNMKTLLRDKKDSSPVKDNYSLLMSSCDLIQSVRDGLPAAETLEMLAAQDYIFEDTSKDYNKIVRVLGAFSRNLHTWDEKPTASGWARPEDVSYVLSHADAFNFWMALLLKTEGDSTLKRIKIKDKSVYDILNGDVSKHNQQARMLLYHINTVSNIAIELESANGLKDKSLRDSMLHAGYGKLAIALSDLLSETSAVFEIETDALKTCTKVLRSAGQLENALRTKQFGSALTQVVHLMEVAFGENSQWPRHLSKYGDLLVALIESKDEKTMKAALDNAALPVQSYRQKRQPKAFNFSLNMYPGLSIGTEWSIDSAGDVGKGGFLVAPTVPVGLGVNWGVSIGSISVFVPIIDIGAVAAFRIQDNVSELPELEWANVVAPGFYLFWGIKKSPISIGLGTQLGPALRKVTTEGKTLEQRNFRFSFTLGVDVPIF